MYTWLVYAVVEYFFTSVLPLFHGDYVFSPWYWRWSSILLVAYTMFGLLTGVVIGCFAQIINGKTITNDEIRRRILTVCTLTLPVAYLLSRITLSFSNGAAWVAFAVYLLIIIALCARLIWPGRAHWSDVLLGPWGIAFLCLLAGRIDDTSTSRVFIAILTTVALALLAGRIALVNSLTTLNAPVLRQMLAVALGLTIVLGTTWGLQTKPQMKIPHGGKEVSRPNRPNVVLIVMDTVRADHLPFYGYKRNTAPNLNAFTRESTLYTRAISTSDITLGSHASMFTGLYVSWHGAHIVHTADPAARALDQRFHTLPEILAENGYRTMGVSANYVYLDEKYGLNQGFQIYDSRRSAHFFGGEWNNRAPIKSGLRPLARKILSFFISTTEMDMRVRRAAEINAEVFQLLGQTAKRDRRPFFLFINYMDAHLPYIPPPPFDRLFPGKVERMTYDDVLSLREDVSKLRRTITDEEKNHLISQYDGGIAYMDSQIVKVISWLKQSDLYDNTMIIITSDHGEAFGERNLLSHCVSVYQDQVHVALLIRYPGQKSGRTVDRLVSHVDLMPAILEAAGYKVASGVQGQSLERAHGSSRRVLSESHANPFLISWHPRFRRVERTLLEDSMKFVVSTTGKRELFNLTDDPDEKINRFHPDNPSAKNLQTALESLLLTIPKEQSDPRRPDPESYERLKSLGYTQ